MPEQLALCGGSPVRSSLLPYGRQQVGEDDIAAVVAVLRSDWLTVGPAVDAFERAFAEFVGAQYAVAVSSGTAALHAAMHALGVGPGDEVIVPSMTFAASANCVLYQGGVPIFADVEPETLLLDPLQVEAKITYRTKAIVAVDYAGQPCDYDALADIARRYGLALVADACHSVGGSYRGRAVGTLGDLTAFSFHPVKHLTTGEGGMVTTNDADLARRMRIFRNHGVSTDHRQRAERGSFYYEMVTLGYNYRITDFQCALGLSQLGKLSSFVHRRQQIAAWYDAVLTTLNCVTPLVARPDRVHAYHLYPVQFDVAALGVSRDSLYTALRAENIGVNVHYLPVHLHPYYRERFSIGPALCPVAEAAYARLISLPLFPCMTDEDAADVVAAVSKVVGHYNRIKVHFAA
ncbi:MAG: UDP-4-amino-4,6-dideoxy-N-acetyl-beta-L-altrosamine transaminase [Deltaproteobacteria bacterium]|nr:UDP-4-amino-4,6-dideoxy-N-acetyl-beta-L-altrosamine transaminase [Deltaproteobacteria bacterium]